MKLSKIVKTGAKDSLRILFLAAALDIGACVSYYNYELLDKTVYSAKWEKILDCMKFSRDRITIAQPNRYYKVKTDGFFCGTSMSRCDGLYVPLLRWVFLSEEGVVNDSIRSHEEIHSFGISLWSDNKADYEVSRCNKRKSS